MVHTTKVFKSDSFQHCCMDINDRGTGPETFQILVLITKAKGYDIVFFLGPPFVAIILLIN